MAERHQLYVGGALKALLAGSKHSLSTVVNTLIERYAGIVKRAGSTPMMSFHAELYSNVLREKPNPLTSDEIAVFPAMCRDWLARHPEFPQEPGKTALMILDNSPFIDLVALVHKMESQLNNKGHGNG